MSNINELVLYEASIGTAASGYLPVSMTLLHNMPVVGSVLGGAFGTYQQSRLNDLQDKYDMLRGIQPNRNKIHDYLGMAASGLVGAIPYVGGFFNYMKGGEADELQDQIEKMKTTMAYNNLQNGQAPIQPMPQG